MKAKWATTKQSSRPMDFDELVHFVCLRCSGDVAYCGAKTTQDVPDDTKDLTCVVCVDLATSNDDICICERETNA